MQSGALRRPPAPLSGDDFISVGSARHGTRENRLNDAFFLDRGGEVGQGIVAEIPARVAGIGAEKFDRNFLRRAGSSGALRDFPGPAKKRGKTAPKPRRRFFGGFSWLHAEIPRLRIILLGAGPRTRTVSKARIRQPSPSP